jgi:hypothetical protein
MSKQVQYFSTVYFTRIKGEKENFYSAINKYPRFKKTLVVTHNGIWVNKNESHCFVVQ